jgi:curved DNA-binding protein CbpA
MQPAPRPSREELRLFSERVHRSLLERPIELAATEHREKVAGLLRQLGELSHYQLLAVAASASTPEVHEGYERVARLVHPSHAHRLGLDGREGVLEVIFEQATQAYLILSHPERRKEYDRELDPEAWARPMARKPRAEEVRERARGYYNRAMSYAAAEDYHFGVELLREAVRLDPRPEYFALLGELQAKNSNWLHHAAESYRQALAIGGADPALEAALQRVQDRLAGVAGEEE